MRKICIAAALLLLNAGTGVANSTTLVGDEVTIIATASDGSSVSEQVIVQEFALTNPRCVFGVVPPDPPKCQALQLVPGDPDGDLVDIKADYVLLDLPTPRTIAPPAPGEFDRSVTFADLDWIDWPEAFLVDIVLTTNIPDFDAARVAFGADWVSIVLAGQEFGSLNTPEGGFIRVDLIAGVSEPPTLALIALALFGMRWRVIHTAKKRIHRKDAKALRKTFGRNARYALA